MIQGVILLILLKIYDKNLSALKFYFSQILFCGFCIAMALNIVPNVIFDLSMVINIIFGIIN